MSKAYVFTLAPIVHTFLTDRGYDVNKLTQAIESEGNSNLKLDTETSGVSQRHSYTPASVNSRGGKPASSRAKITHSLVFDGTGSAPEVFAAWHDATVAMAKRYGELTAIPLPVQLKAWLDGKFNLDGAKNTVRRNGDVKKVPPAQVPA